MVTQIIGTVGEDWLFGTDGDDLLMGLDGDDRIYGGDGNDIINPGEGDALMAGGTGNDVYYLLGGRIVRPNDPPGLDPTGIWENENEGIDTIYVTGEVTIPPNVENLFVLEGFRITNIMGSGVGALTGNALDNVIRSNSFANDLRGMDGNDTLDGRGGNDILAGGNGDDLLIGGAGIDAINGGNGFDTASYATSSAGVTIGLSNGSGTGGEAQGDTLTAVERIIGSNFNDVLSGYTIDADGDGSVDASTLEGLGGNDTLNGGLGANTLDGGAGSDTLIGNGGNDTVRVTGSDGVGDTWSGGAGTDKVVVYGTSSLTLSAFNAAAASIEQWTGNGQAVLGTSAANTFNFAGLTSKTGILYIDGASGNDIITASNFNDDIRGGAGLDTLSGGAGTDILNGGLGNDTLSGGSGKDYFVFNKTLSSTSNVDTILNFSTVDDTIRLENSIFTALGSATGTLSAAKFFASANGLAGAADDRIIYNTTTGALSYDSNGNAAGGAIKFAQLNPHVTLTSADFSII